MKAKQMMLEPLSIRVDAQYQRPLHEKHVETMRATLDPLALGVIIISERSNGDFYVLDGQHRLAALIRNGDGHTPVPCLVYEGLSVADEADIFYMQSKARAVTPVDLFKARLFAGEPVAIMINDVLRKYGLKVEARPEYGNVSAVKQMELILSYGGITHFERVIRLVTEIWHNERKAVPGFIFGGMDRLLRQYPGKQQIDERRLVQKLSLEPRNEIEKLAKSIRAAIEGATTGDSKGAAAAYGRAFAQIYNKGLSGKNRLDPWDQVKGPGSATANRWAASDPEPVSASA